MVAGSEYGRELPFETSPLPSLFAPSEEDTVLFENSTRQRRTGSSSGIDRLGVPLGIFVPVLRIFFAETSG
jgi:hypothetical protein